MIQYNFMIPGKPRGKGRPRFTRNGHTYTDQKTRAYEDLTKAIFHRLSSEPIPEGYFIRVRIVAHYMIPKSASKADKAKMIAGFYPVKAKPDIDNIAKIVLDALNGEAWRDDAQVTELNVKKVYSTINAVEVEITGTRMKEHESG